MTKIIIVLAGNAIFFGILLLIWFVNRRMPQWEAKQIERQKQRAQRLDQERTQSADEEPAAKK